MQPKAAGDGFSLTKSGNELPAFGCRNQGLVVSGEERFLGYSLISGADAAMVGLGAAHPSMAIELIEAHVHRDASRFLELTAALDDLARPIFRAPMEGSVLRLLRSMVQLGILPADAANDPWGPGRAS